MVPDVPAMWSHDDDVSYGPHNARHQSAHLQVRMRAQRNVDGPMQLGAEPEPVALEPGTPAKLSLACSKCLREMRVYKLESRKGQRDLYTLQCTHCGALTVRHIHKKSP